MRRQTPIAHQLYSYLFPHPTPNDPPSFSAHLARNLVPEVREEVQHFYGHLSTVEARYPGLNYCYPPHRMRLGRFEHHHRLFEAFDDLRLTYAEIQDFCCWEGTKWARERYEKDEKIKVFDTTGDDIPPWVDRRSVSRQARRVEFSNQRRQSIQRQTDISVVVEEAGSTLSSQPADDEEMSDADSAAAAEEEGEGEEERESAMMRETRAEAAAAADLHLEELRRHRDRSVTQRLIAAWEQGHSLPPEIEQYLKDQSERGTLSSNVDLQRLWQTSLTAHGSHGMRARPSSSAMRNNPAVPAASARTRAAA